MEWSTLKTCISECIKHNATTCNIGCKDQTSLKDTTLFTKMGKILDYKHVKLKCITNIFNMKLDKLKCEFKWEDFFEESLNWFKIWTSLCKSDARLKSKQFHWKMLHRVIHTEQKLAIFGISSGLCKMCNIHLESLVHLL